VKKAVNNRSIVVQCDETTDRKGQAVFIIIFKILPNDDTTECKLLVAAVTVLDACTGELCSKAVIQVISSKYLL